MQTTLAYHLSDTDASAAIGIGSRFGLGKVRDIEVNQLWLQDKLYIGEIALNKVGTNQNIADALTKAVSVEVLGCHVNNSSGECRRDRHRIAPEIDDEDSEKIGKGSEQEQWLESMVAADGNN